MMDLKRICCRLSCCLVGPVLAWTVLVASPILADDSSCFREISRWPYGPASAIEMDYPRLYLGSGSVLEVLEISDPIHPHQISNLILTDIIKDIEIHGTFLFLALSPPALAIVDISDPCSPQVLSLLKLDGFEAEDLSVSASRVFIIIDSIKLIIVDVNDPLFPQIVGEWTDQDYISRVVADDDGYAYVAHHAYGFVVLDVHDPSRPIELGGGSVQCLGPIDDIQKHGPVVYLHAHYYGPCFWGGLFAFDVTDPMNIREVAFSEGPATSENVFLTVSEDDTVLVDITDPAQPSIAAWIGWGSRVVDPRAKYYGHYIFRSEGYTGLEIMDCTDPQHPFIAGTYVMAQNPWRIKLDGNLAVSDYLRDSLAVFDVSASDLPAQISTYELNEGVNGYVIVEGMLYVSAGQTFHVLSFTRNGAISEIGSVEGIAGGSGLALYQHWAYVAAHNELFVVDIANPVFPRAVGHVETDYDSYIGGITSGALYMLDSSWEAPGLVVYDLSDPAAPVESNFISGINPDGLAIKGKYLFLSDRRAYTKELVVYDIQDPINPIEISSVPLPSSGGLILHGDLIYVTQNRELSIIDISNPMKPIIRYTLAMEVHGYSSDVDDERLILLSGSYGWYVYDISRCAHSIHDRPVTAP